MNSITLDSSSDLDFNIIYTKLEKKIDFLVVSFHIELYKNDILLFLWQLIKKINFSNFNTEKMLYSYMSISLKNYCIKLYNKNIKNNNIIYNSEITNIELDKNSYDHTLLDNSSLIFDDLVSSLPKKQRDILTMRYKYCLSDLEIAQSLHISRQAVHKNRLRALNSLKKIIC